MTCARDAFWIPWLQCNASVKGEGMGLQVDHLSSVVATNVTHTIKRRPIRSPYRDQRLGHFSSSAPIAFNLQQKKTKNCIPSPQLPPNPSDHVVASTAVCLRGQMLARCVRGVHIVTDSDRQYTGASSGKLPPTTTTSSSSESLQRQEHSIPLHTFTPSLRDLLFAVAESLPRSCSCELSEDSDIHSVL